MMKCCTTWLQPLSLSISWLWCDGHMALGLQIPCNEHEVFPLRLEGFNFHLICGTKVVCKCDFMVHPVALKISGFLCRETLQMKD